jgi:hypothetical protein
MFRGTTMGRELWTDKYLDAMRAEKDPAADRVVEAIYASHSLDGVNRLLMNMVRNTDPPPAEVVRLVDDYFTATAALPPWTDPTKIELAEDLFSRHGMLGTTILCCASLPECYLDKLDVPVLASTTQLADHVYRRIFETSHMVITVMQPGGMAPAVRATAGSGRKPKPRHAADDDVAVPGEGIRCCQKVRLMHAAIRHLLLAEGAAGGKDELGHTLVRQRWDLASGQPINQESIAYVILTFSYVGLRGLDTLGAHPTQEEREAYVHAWSVIGHVMGVRDELLARNFDDAKFLFETIKRRRRGLSPDGKALTAALLKWMEDAVPTGMKSMPKEMLCKLIGNDDAKLLGVRLDEDQRVEGGLAAAILHVAEHLYAELLELPPFRQIAEALFHAIVHHVWDMKKGWDRETFALPPSLEKSWRVQRKAPAA